MNANKNTKNHAQMIALMGVVCAISVFMISSLSAEIANVDFIVKSGDTTPLSAHFDNIKESFGLSFNYNLVEIQIAGDESIMGGDLDYVDTAFQNTYNDFFNIIFKHSMFLDAKLIDFWFSHQDPILGNTLYWAKVTLSIDDGESRISEDINYLLACNPLT